MDADITEFDNNTSIGSNEPVRSCDDQPGSSKTLLSVEEIILRN